MSLLSALRARTSEMTDALRALVETESPSSDAEACRACARVTDNLAADLIGESGQVVHTAGRVHLRWQFGSAPRVVLLGHLDTVWPLGTVERWPFSVDRDTATGPGCFDMKAGVVQLLFALYELGDLDGISVLLTTDEEIGGPSSRDLIRETVTGSQAVLVLEPSANGSLKTQRKGVASYRVHVMGRAAHAGLDPENGINAAIEAARQIAAIAVLSRPHEGTTVTPSVVHVGTTSNTVPGAGVIDVDVRAFSAEELQRVDTGLHALRPTLEGASIEVETGPHVPPLPRFVAAELFRLAQKLAEREGLPAITEAAVGGGSDGNFTAQLGLPTLDGLGAVGGNAHAEGEYVSIPAMAERAALVAALVSELKSSTA